MYRMRSSLLISTYQAGKLILISPLSEDKLIQLPRTFSKPMGVALSHDQQQMAIATKDAVVALSNSIELAAHYPKKVGTYDAMYLPRVCYYTNALDIHDLEFLGNDIVAVNTLFSCIMKISDKYSFEPIWKPPFITSLMSEDRCHLNGLAISDDRIAYASAFSNSNAQGGWRKTIPNSGVLIDVQSNSVIAEGLAMPHSPRIIEGRLMVLLSATGQLIEVDTKRGTITEVRKLPGFVRGMAYHNGYIFIGHSRLRENSSSFGKLSLPYEKRKAGLSIIHLQTGALIGDLTYLQSVDEIYDVKILKNSSRPNILNNLTDDFKRGLSTPEKTYWAKPETNPEL